MVLELRDFQIGLEDPERLVAGTGRIRQGGQLLGLRDAAVWLGNLTEQRQPQSRPQLFR